jgi:hypothetical protein
MVRDGVKFCFYLGPPSTELAQAIMRSLDTYVDAVGPKTLDSYLDTEGDFQQLDAQSWEDTRRQLLESQGSRIELMDDPSVGAAAFRFEYYVRRLGDPFADTERRLVSAVGFSFPTEFLEAQGPSHLHQLALELATPLPFTSGHGGLFFTSMLGYRETAEALSRLCLRHPGMDIGEVEDLAMHLEGRVKGPSWLTFLGQPVLGELGGVAGLRSRLTSPGTTVQPLNGERAVISLGEWPEAGDTEAGHNLPEYRELARVLEPWLFHANRPWSPYFPEDIWKRWERRFLD